MTEGPLLLKIVKKLPVISPDTVEMKRVQMIARMINANCSTFVLLCSSECFLLVLLVVGSCCQPFV